MTEIKYELHMTDGDIDQCECCGSEVPTYDFRKPIANASKITEVTQLLCEICSTTFISQAWFYRSRESWAQVEMYQTLAAVANVLLQRIDALERKISSEKPST